MKINVPELVTLPLICLLGACATQDPAQDADTSHLDRDADGDAGAGADVLDEPDGGREADASDSIVEPRENWSRSVEAMILTVDVSDRSARATLEIGPSSAAGLSLEVGSLAIGTIESEGVALAYDVVDGRLDVGLAASDARQSISIEYEYEIGDDFDGALAGGSTLTWPYYCDNLFPCRTDPAESLTFELELTGIPEGERAIYPSSVETPAPAYMLAWAVGAYESEVVGQTTSGIDVVAYYLPGGRAEAFEGMEYVAAAMEWFETTLGPYPFGLEVAGVPVDWGPGSLGGMEHHPFWHVGASDMGDAETHVHEAAHGWYGNGVRIACWEDFVLSEGTVSYLTAIAIGEAAGEAAESQLWSQYWEHLDWAQASEPMTIAWPEGCGDIDILEDDLFSSIPYMKGAFFFHALAARVGEEELLAALATFFADSLGEAATMQALLDTIAMLTGYDPTACADVWLRDPALPSMDVCPAG